MAISFNTNSAFNLKPINIEAVRDQLLFTNKRIIAIDVQGITGKRKSFATMPYSKIQYFSIQTPGFIEIFPDSELFVMFSNVFTIKCDLGFGC